MARGLGQTLVVGTVIGCVCSLPSCMLASLNSLLRYLACVVIYPNVKLTLQGVMSCIPDVRVLLQVTVCVSCLVMYCIVWWQWPGRDRVCQLLKPPRRTMRRCSNGWHSLVEYTKSHLNWVICQQGFATWSDVSGLWYTSNPNGTALTWQPFQPATLRGLLYLSAWRPSSWKQVPRTVYRLNVRAHALIWRVTSYHVKLHIRVWLVVMEWVFCRFVSNNVLRRAGPHLDVLKQHKVKFLLFRQLPLRFVSRLWGRINQVDLPLWLRPYACGLYIRMFGCCLQDALITDLTHYKNLSEFFRRSLKPHLRPVDKAHCLTSPADGRILHVGPVENGVLEQIKYVTFSLSHFMGCDINFIDAVKHRTRNSVKQANTTKYESVENPCSIYANIIISDNDDKKPVLADGSSSHEQFVKIQDQFADHWTTEHIPLCDDNDPTMYFDADYKPFSESCGTFDDSHRFHVQTSYRKRMITLDNDNNKSKDDEYEMEEHIIEQTFSIEEKDLNYLSASHIGESHPNYISPVIGASEKSKVWQSDNCFSSHLVINPQNVLHQCIVYLAPGDYHRFHSPADWTVYSRRHFPGDLFSVNPSVAGWLQGLFSINERVMYVGRWQHGFFSMTAVGATNVGSINVFFDQKLQTNIASTNLEHCSYSEVTFRSRNQNGVHLKRGELMGEFNLGSTIVLVFEAPPEFKLRLNPGDRVRYGQGIVNLKRHHYSKLRHKHRRR